MFAALYLLCRLLLAALVDLRRPDATLRMELLILRHQLHVLERQVAKPQWRRADRLLLTSLSRRVPRSAWSSFLVGPDTLLRWHRDLVRHKWGLSDPLFPTRRGQPLSRDAVEHRLATYVTVAAGACPSLQTKRISAHVLRHTAAMQLLHAGIDTSVIALWLGHEHVDTTQIYLHADLALKERALARTTPPGTTPGRYRPPDSLLAFLESL